MLRKWLMAYHLKKWLDSPRTMGGWFHKCEYIRLSRYMSRKKFLKTPSLIIFSHVEGGK